MMRVVPESGKITATVDVLPRRDGLVKVRMVIWSGEDFRSPWIKRGALFASEDAARNMAERMRDALELVGIPVDGVEAASEPLLPAVDEACEYPRVD